MDRPSLHTWLVFPIVNPSIPRDAKCNKPLWSLLKLLRFLELCTVNHIVSLKMCQLISEQLQYWPGYLEQFQIFVICKPDKLHNRKGGGLKAWQYLLQGSACSLSLSLCLGYAYTVVFVFSCRRHSYNVWWMDYYPIENPNLQLPN